MNVSAILQNGRTVKGNGGESCVHIFVWATHSFWAPLYVCDCLTSG
jgi:hypothetical protein